MLNKCFLSCSLDVTKERLGEVAEDEYNGQCHYVITRGSLGDFNGDKSAGE